MAEPQTLEEMTADYQRKRRDEIFQGAQRVMGGLSNDPDIMKYVVEKQAGLGAKDRAELRTAVTEQMADFQAGLRLDPALITEAMKQAASLEKQGSINNTDMDAIKYASQIAQGLEGFNDQQLKLMKAKSVDWDEALGRAAGSTPNKVFVKAYQATLGAIEGGTVPWPKILQEQIDGSGGALQDRDLLALLGAIREKKGWTNEEMKSEAEKHAMTGGQDVWTVYTRELGKLSAANVEFKDLEREKAKLIAKGNKFGGMNISANGKKFIQAFLGGDPQAFAEMMATLGGGAGREMSDAETETYEEMKATLDFLESNDPDSRYYRDMIMKDQRFIDWMDAQKYDNPQEAFKIWIKNARTQARRTKRDTKRQEQINAAVGATPGAVKGAIGRLRTPAATLQEAATRTAEGYQPRPGKELWLQERRRARYAEDEEPGEAIAEEPEAKDEGRVARWRAARAAEAAAADPDIPEEAPTYPSTTSDVSYEGASLGETPEQERRRLLNGAILGSAQATV